MVLFSWIFYQVLDKNEELFHLMKCLFSLLGMWFLLMKMYGTITYHSQTYTVKSIHIAMSSTFDQTLYKCLILTTHQLFDPILVMPFYHILLAFWWKLLSFDDVFFEVQFLPICENPETYIGRWMPFLPEGKIILN